MGDMIARDVLVVEDDRDTAELERRTLARSGIKAHLAATVGEAKAALEALTFQAVLDGFGDNLLAAHGGDEHDRNGWRQGTSKLDYIPGVTIR